MNNAPQTAATTATISTKDVWRLFWIGIVLGGIIAVITRFPAYSDAYYYYGVALRLVEGKGLTEASMFTYLSNAPTFPAPGNLYWMPMPTLIAAVGMLLFGHNYDAAQLGFIPLHAGIAVIAYWIGWRMTKTRKIAWGAGLLALFSVHYPPYLITTGTLGPYGFIGGLCLLMIGIGVEPIIQDDQTTKPQTDGRWWFFAGMLSGLGYLTRSDGMILVGVIGLAILFRRISWRFKAQHIALAAVGCLLVISPWLIRNKIAIGSFFPSGTFQVVFMRDYTEMWNYPPVISAQDFFASGLNNIIASRTQVLFSKEPSGLVWQFLDWEGFLILMPLMLWGLWRNRKSPLLRGFMLYALFMHLILFVLFPLPAYRGSVFHSSAATMPFWATLAVLGMDDLVKIIFKRRPRFRPVALRVIPRALIGVALMITLYSIAARTALMGKDCPHCDEIKALLPPDAVVAIDDPLSFHYFTGLNSLPLPNASPKVFPEISSRYLLTHIIIPKNHNPLFDGIYNDTAPLPYLHMIADKGDYKIFEFVWLT
jgi:4-amino-4-deoxy-L-arabinose transferase-like glycosyltransferase